MTSCCISTFFCTPCSDQLVISILRRGPAESMWPPLRDDSWIVRFLKYAFFYAFAIYGWCILCALEVLLNGPDILAEELFVKPHRRWLLSRYKLEGIRVMGLVKATHRGDHMIVEYSVAPSDTTDAFQEESNVIQKCVCCSHYDFHKKIADGSDVALLVLPTLPSSGYPEEIVLQQWETERFDVRRFLTQLGLACFYFIRGTLLVAVLFAVLFWLQVEDVGDSRGFFLHNVILIAETNLRVLYPVPMMYMMTSMIMPIKHDRNIYLTTMEGRLKQIHRANEKLKRLLAANNEQALVENDCQLQNDQSNC